MGFTQNEGFTATRTFFLVFFSLPNFPTGAWDLLKMKHLLLQELLFLITDKTTEEIFMLYSKSQDDVQLYGT